MRRCNACKIEFTGNIDRCPLCQSELTGDAERAVFPHNVVHKSGVLALSVLAFATGVSVLVMLFSGFILPLPVSVVSISCFALAVNYLFVRNILVHSPGFLRATMRYFLLLLIIAALWFLLTDELAITTFVIPSICMIALVFDGVLLVIFRGQLVSGYAKYLLFDMVVGISSLALIGLGLTTWDLPAALSALFACVMLLALLVFGHRNLIDELRKLFHA